LHPITYCKFFVFIGHLILCNLWVGQSTNLRYPMKCFSKKIFFASFLNHSIQVSKNMSIVVKPRNCVPMKLNDVTVISKWHRLNDFCVLELYLLLRLNHWHCPVHVVAAKRAWSQGRQACHDERTGQRQWQRWDCAPMALSL